MTAATNKVSKELTSDELLDVLNLTDLPSADTLDATMKDLVEAESFRDPSMTASLGGFNLKVFLANDLSERDYYFTYEVPIDGELHVVINLAHPYMSQITGSDGGGKLLPVMHFNADR